MCRNEGQKELMVLVQGNLRKRHSQEMEIKRTQETHLDEPFMCNVCQRGFCQSNKLRAHITKHVKKCSSINVIHIRGQSRETYQPKKTSDGTSLDM